MASIRSLLPAVLAVAGSCAAAQNWSHYVRIAGHSLGPANAAAIVSESVHSNVFGIEVDNDIPGRYESFLDPAAKLAAIRQAARLSQNPHQLMSLAAGPAGATSSPRFCHGASSSQISVLETNATGSLGTF